MAPRSLFDYELLYVESGSGTVTFSDSVCRFQSGDILLIRPREEHTFCFLTDLSQPHIHFDLIEDESSPEIPISCTRYDDMTEEQRALVRCDLLADIPIPHLIRTASNRTLAGLIVEVGEIWQKRPPFCSLLLKETMTDLLRQLLLRYGKPEDETPDDRRIFFFARDYIETYHNTALPTPALTLARIAERFTLSVSSLSHGFRRCYGVSPIAYYNHIRVQRANEILAQESVSISEAAAMLGFDSIYAFSRFYQSHTGLSPTEKRKQN